METVEISKLDEFRKLKSKADVADFLGISEKKLIMILYVNKVNAYYDTFELPKKNSKDMRKINAPQDILKIIQSKLKEVLTELYLEKSQKSATGFLPEKSIVDNAEVHLDSNCVLNIDFKDFFDQINFGRIRGLFIKKYNLDANAATIISQLLTLDGKLPQGSPSSPIVTNLICSKLDKNLEKFARQHNIRYTRYVDDLTFSTTSTSFPNSVCMINDKKQIEVGDALMKIIDFNGFLINENKIYYSTKKKRQEVTGLVINQKLNVKREYLRNLRVLMHKTKKKKENNESIETYRSQILGKINFLKMVRGADDSYFNHFAYNYNRLYGEHFSEVDRKRDISTWLFNRIYAIDTYEVFEKIENIPIHKYEFGNGTGFNLQNYGFITCEHVIKNVRRFDFLKITNHHEIVDFKVNSENLVTDKVQDYACYKQTYYGRQFLQANPNFSYRIQETVYICGFPAFNFRYGSKVTIKSARITGQKYCQGRFLYVVDSIIEKGFSGGPVLDSDGKVIGIITNGGLELENPVFGFIPINNLIERLL